MSLEFLHEDNQAGQVLLQLVSRGSAIITELLRLSDHIPDPFLGNPQNPQDRVSAMSSAGSFVMYIAISFACL